MSASLSSHAVRLSSQSRAVLVGWSLMVLVIFGMATRVEPDSRGYGTHQQFGFPPCSFRVLWQMPCPSCGSTTAFSLFVRGKWIAAANANLGATFLAVSLSLSCPWCLYSAWSGHAWRMRDPWGISLLLMIIFVSLTVIHWLVRILI